MHKFDEMYEQYKTDPQSVSASWQEFFHGYEPEPELDFDPIADATWPLVKAVLESEPVRVHAVAGEQLLLIDTLDELDVPRAQKIAREFKLRLAVRGNVDREVLDLGELISEFEVLLRRLTYGRPSSLRR